MQKYPPGGMNLGKVLGKNPGKQGQFTEYKLRVPKNLLKRYSVMKIRAPRPIKFGEIKEANMVRKTKKQVYVEEEGSAMPTHGAGSVYNYERKEEARKKRRGYIKQTVNTDDLPYALRLGGKSGKRYTGKKEPILEHSSYYILTQCPDGVFEAVPVQAWYNFMPDINYATLSIEEVDNEFSKRDRTLSYFTKKYNFGNDDDNMHMTEHFGDKVKHTDRDHGLLIHDDLDMDDDDIKDEGSEDEKPATKKQSKKEKDLFRGKRKAKPTGSDSDEEEELENFDSKEVDYMSESSSEDELLGMDDEPDPEKDNAGKAKDDLNLFTDSEDEEEEQELNEAGKELKAILKKETGADSSEEDVDDDEEEEDEDIDNEFTHSAVFLQGKDKKKKGRTGSSSSSKPSSRSNTPIQLEQAADTVSQAANSLKEGKPSLKRSHDNSSPSPQSKKQKLIALAGGAVPTIRSESPISSTETFRTNSPALRPSTPSDAGNGITEESIRRYLTHKPMTTTDLMRKFKTKKTGLSKEQTVNAIATILKKIQPHQEKIDGKLYLSIKTKK